MADFSEPAPFDITVYGRTYYLAPTCHACPEQYDVCDEQGKDVAYIRLRHGALRVDCPDNGGETVLQAAPRGDGGFGNDEREGWLTAAVLAIHAHRQRLKPEPCHWCDEPIDEGGTDILCHACYDGWVVDTFGTRLLVDP